MMATLPPERAVGVVIEGRVQGVGFRNWAQRIARQLGLVGWVRNRQNGTVEAVFAGSTGMVEEMLARCRNGPRSARVDRLDVCDVPAPVMVDFEVHEDD